MSAAADSRLPGAARPEDGGAAQWALPGPVRVLLGFALRLVLTLLGLLTLLFFLVRLKGDPAGVLAGPSATPADLDAIRAAYGLDRPLPVQYVEFLGNTARLDFGDSVFSGQPALDSVLGVLPNTLVLIAATMLLSLAIGVPAGMALHHGPRPVRMLLGALLTLAQAVPTFVIGVGLILLFAVQMGALPAYGSGTFATLVMPALTLAMFTIARTGRMTEAELDLVAEQDFLRTAAAKGASERRVRWRHALPNAFPAVASALVVELSYLLSGAVVVEVLFAYDGIGKKLVDAIFARDYPIVQSAVFVIGIIVIVVNLVGELLLRMLDPRTGRETT